MKFDRRTLFRYGLHGAGAVLAARVGVDALGTLTGDSPSVDLSGARLAGSVPAPRIVTRAEWGANESLRRGTPSFAPISKMIVHHTVTANEEADPRQRVRAIYQFHTQSNGWDDIGYNFLIDQQGRIYEGRWARAYRSGEVHSGESTDGEGVVGAHAQHHNSGSVGIALLGTFSSASPSSAAVESLVKLCSWIAARHRIDPMDRSAYANGMGQTVAFYNIAGHRDVKSTACPGNGLYTYLDDVRRQVALTIARGFIGYRIVSSTGAVAHFGGARNYGDVHSHGVQTEVTGGAAFPNSQAYWLVDRYGGVFSFAGAPYKGSIPGLRAQGISVGRSRVAGITPTTSGKGYWLFDQAGGIFSFGDAHFSGSVPWLRQRGISVGPARIVAMTPTPTGKGYWVLDSQGGVFAFGDARFKGSVPDLRRQGHRIGPAAIVGMAATPSGNGYWVLDSAGGVFAFGDARYYGSLPGLGRYEGRARRLVPAPGGRGYVILTNTGAVYTFGSAPFHGRWSAPGLDAVDLIPVIRG